MPVVGKPSLIALMILLSACGGSSETTTTGGDATTTGDGATGSTTATVTTRPAAAAYDIAGTWTDTDVVGSNSCGLPQPAPGSSRVTPGIVIEQTGRHILLTAPPNIAGTQTVARGRMTDDGSMVLTGADSGTTVTLRLRASSDRKLSGTSRVVADGCTYDFSNNLVRTK